MRKSIVARETAHVRAALATVEDVEQVVYGATLDDLDLERLRSAITRTLTEIPPVRTSVAAEVLGLTAKTVRQWMADGVLTAAGEGTPQRVDAERLHEVLRLVRDLREAGRTRGLADEVWRRLTDHAQIDSDDFQHGLAQVRSGEGLVRLVPDSE